MNELNIFSYIQKNSSFYNLIKSEQDIEAILNVPNSLRNFLKKLRSGRDKEKLQKQVLDDLEKLQQRLKTLNQYAIFEAPPKRTPALAKMLQEIITWLQEIQRKRGNAEGIAQEIERLLPDLEKEVKVLTDESCLEYVVKATKWEEDPSKPNSPLKRCREHLENLKKAYDQLGYRSKIFHMQLEERGLFGASQDFGKYLFEVGLEIDPYLNVPLLPASSIKGAVRKAYETLQPVKNWPPPEKVFGSSKSPEEGGTIGAIIFTDCYPVKAGRGNFVLYPDVLTPHYPEDLMGELDHEPKPISHLSIAPETCFGLVIAYKREELTDEILRQTLELAIDMGIGARTSAGYGRFKLTEVTE